MPIYEYICENCQNELEAIQKISDPQLTDCPQCGKSALKRKTSISAFHLKGGGWYKDGYSVPNSTPDKTNGSSDKTNGSSSTSAAEPAKQSDTKAAPASDKTATPSGSVASSTSDTSSSAAS